MDQKETQSKEKTKFSKESTGVRSNAPSDERVRKIPLGQRLLGKPELGAVSGAILIFIVFAIIARGSGMFSVGGVISFLTVSAELGIIAAAAALLMVAGEFDLSIGSMIALAGVCIALPVYIWGWPIWVALIFAFSIAILVGLINGLFVMKTGLPSFIVTLAMLFILRGITVVLTRGVTGQTLVRLDKEAIQSDPIGNFLGTPLFHIPDPGFPDVGVPVSLLLWIVIIFAGVYTLRRTKFGNWIFASGGDQNAAKNMGVPVLRVKVILFILTACSATLFAAVQVLQYQTADVLRGELKELEAIAAAVIGGTLLTGGFGTIIGSAIGALIFGTVQIGFSYTDIDSDWFKIFVGAIMLTAVFFNDLLRRRVMTQK